MTAPATHSAAPPPTLPAAGETARGLLTPVDARIKLLALLGYVFAITFTTEGAWAVLALLAAPVLVLLAISGVPPRTIARRSLLAAPFVLAAVPLLVTREGEPVAELPLVEWSITAEGARALGTILLKSWLSVLLATMLTATTPATELLGALRALRVPALLIAVIGFAYRYLFLIREEAQRMLRARSARAAALPDRHSGGSWRWRATIAGRLVGTLFVRSYERSERVYTAMLLRGYAGEPRLLTPPRARGAHVLLAAVLVAYAWAVQVQARV
jgi:cobalt ABC transporter, permease protein CbiQ